MPFDKSQALDAAKQHLQQGNTEAAIGVYLKVIDDNRSDLETIDALGDLYANEGRVQDAIEKFSKVADGYLADSLTRKAITVLRKMTALDPGHLDTCIKLAGAYAQAGLLSDARQHYLQIAGNYSRKGQTMDALAVYCKIVALDPSNTSMRIKLGELFLREGLNEQAYETFITAANQLATQGEHRRALNAYNEALAIRPEGAEALAGIKRVTGGDDAALTDKALATGSLSGPLSKPSPTTEPDSRHTSSTLAINSDPGDSTFVVQEISRAELLVAYGRADEAISMLKNVATSLPESIDVRIKLKDIYLRNGMMVEASGVCRELEMIYREQGDDSRARDYDMRASRLAQLTEQPSGDLRGPIPEPVAAPVLSVAGQPSPIKSNHTTNLTSVTDLNQALTPPLASPPLSIAERPLSPQLQLVSQEEPKQQALVKKDFESSNRVAVEVSLSPRIELVTGALQLTRAASSPVVKKRSRVAIAGIAAGILTIIGAGAIAGGLVYENHLNKEYRALTLMSPVELPSPLAVPVPQEQEAAQDTDSITINVTPDVISATKPESLHEPAVDHKPIATEQPAPSPPAAEQAKPVTQKASPSVSPPRTSVNADSRSIADTRAPAGVPTIAPSSPPAPAAPSPKPVTQTPGVVFGAALKRVEPSYPEVARQTNQIGSVRVEVNIDEQGNVTAAHALSGPVLLRNAALGAARGWKFRPSTVAGVPVKTTTVIVFNFKL